MKVMTYVVGFAKDEEDGIYIEKLLNNCVFDWPRVPCIGERLGLWIDDVWIEARVESVYTNFREQGNPYIKESAWGTDWSLALDECEIIEYYKKEEGK